MTTFLQPTSELDERARAMVARLSIALDRSNELVTAAAVFHRPKTAAQEFREWFGSSVMAKASGAPITAFHITDADFPEFDPAKRELGFHFGPLDQLENLARYKDTPPGTNIRPAYLSIKRPIRLQDQGSFHADGIAIQLAKKGLLSLAEAKQIRRECDDDFKARKGHDEAMRRILQSHGYDGIVYKNRFEHAGDSWIALESAQIRPALGHNAAYARRMKEPLPKLRFLPPLPSFDDDVDAGPNLTPEMANALAGALDLNVIVYASNLSTPELGHPSPPSGLRTGNEIWIRETCKHPLLTILAHEFETRLYAGSRRVYESLRGVPSSANNHFSLLEVLSDPIGAQRLRADNPRAFASALNSFDAYAESIASNLVAAAPERLQSRISDTLDLARSKLHLTKSPKRTTRRHP